MGSNLDLPPSPTLILVSIQNTKFSFFISILIILHTFLKWLFYGVILFAIVLLLQPALDGVLPRNIFVPVLNFLEMNVLVIWIQDIYIVNNKKFGSLIYLQLSYKMEKDIYITIS